MIPSGFVCVSCNYSLKSVQVVIGGLKTTDFFLNGKLSTMETNNLILWIKAFHKRLFFSNPGWSGFKLLKEIVVSTSV